MRTSPSLYWGKSFLVIIWLMRRSILSDSVEAMLALLNGSSLVGDVVDGSRELRGGEVVS